MRIIDDERRIEEIRAARQASPEAQARREAVELYSALQPHAKHFHNSGSLFEAVATQRIVRREPITLHAFWGVGGKRNPDTHDHKLLEEFTGIGDAISKKYSPGAKLHLMLADAHGSFNGFPQTVIYEYLVRIQDQAGAKDMEVTWLTDLYKQWDLALPRPNEPIDPSSGFFVDFWSNPDYERQKTQMIESAAKHHQAGIPAEQVAYHYARMRRTEAPHLVRSCEGGILLANTSKDLGKVLLPKELPHMYLKTPPVWFLRAA